MFRSPELMIVYEQLIWSEYCVKDVSYVFYEYFEIKCSHPTEGDG